VQFSFKSPKEAEDCAGIAIPLKESAESSGGTLGNDSIYHILSSY
jgi:hypothetical protein